MDWPRPWLPTTRPARATRPALIRRAPTGWATAPELAPRKSNWACALATPPYYAWPIEGAIAYTFGGLATDTEARVLGREGPIPGLYAAGEITGHFHRSAPNAVAVLRALVYGRIAGRAAIARAAH